PTAGRSTADAAGPYDGTTRRATESIRACPTDESPTPVRASPSVRHRRARVLVVATPRLGAVRNGLRLHLAMVRAPGDPRVRAPGDPARTVELVSDPTGSPGAAETDQTFLRGA